MRKPRQSEPRRCKPQQRKADDLSRCLMPLIADQTVIAVVELSLSGWLVAGVVPGVERQPLKKLKPELDRLLELLRVSCGWAQAWPARASERTWALAEGQKKWPLTTEAPYKVSRTPWRRRCHALHQDGVREAPRHEIAVGGAPAVQLALWGLGLWADAGDWARG